MMMIVVELVCEGRGWGHGKCEVREGVWWWSVRELRCEVVPRELSGERRYGLARERECLFETSHCVAVGGDSECRCGVYQHEP